MLSAKPWKTDALVRLFASVLICVLFISAIATGVFHYFSRTQNHESIGFLLSLVGAFLCLLGALSVLAREWPYEKFLRNLAILLVFSYVGFFLMWLAHRFEIGTQAQMDGSTPRIIIAVLSFQGASLVLVHFFLRAHGVTWRTAFGLLTRPKHALFMGIAVGLSAVPIGWGLQMLSGLLMNLFHVPSHEQEAIKVLRASATGLSRLVLGITAILLAPIAEEILFRGILYPAIKQAGFPRLAIWLTALLFASIHTNLGTFIPLAAFAIALVWLYEQTDNLLAPIAAHSIFNTVNFVMLFAAEYFYRMPGKK
jgi:membrane protease YdiL (CAAX protease family)